MRKFGKVAAFGLVATMVAASFVGCGKKSGDSSDAKGAFTDGGKVLNIYVWNEEFKSRLENHYPGYEKVDATSGKIDGTDVKFTIVANANNAYQDNLDSKILAGGENQANTPDDEKIDIFLIEADYALKYVDADASLALSDLGLSDSDFANQYQYTKDVVTDSNKKLKGASWQGCPGALIYRRDIAKEVLGSDDPAKVQEAVKDWDTFLKTAEDMKKAGYNMTATTNDTYRVFSNNVTSKWVEDGALNIDENLKKWVEMSKEMIDNKQTTSADLWSDTWSAGFYTEGNVFCYFGPAWMIDFSMQADQEGSVGIDGGWAITEGPQGFFWGGTWICAAAGTDNATLVKDIILKMTTDEDILSEIVEKDNDFVNNKNVCAKYAEDENFGDAILGGQNPIGIFSSGVASVDLSNISAYDQGCNEAFQAAMKDYFDGNYSSYDEAVDAFKEAIKTKYADITVE